MRGSVVARLLRLLRGQWGLMVVSVACRIVNLMLGIVVPAVAVAFVFAVADDRSPGLGTVLGALAALALAKGLFRYLEQYTGHAVAFRLLADLRNQVFVWLERLEPARLASERSGDLVARVSGDIGRVEPFYAHTIAPVAASVAVPLLTVVGLGALVDIRPALVVAGAALFYLAVVPWLGSRRVARLGPEERRLAGESAAVVADVVQGAQEIAVLAAGPGVLEMVERSGDELTGTRARLARTAAARSLAGGLVQAAALVGVVVVSVTSGLPVADLAVSVVAAWAVMTPIRALEDVVPETEQSLAAAARLFELADMAPQPAGNEQGGAGAVRFDAVTVLAGSGPILEDVTLEIGDGEFLGVVGPSGSGKSTLVSTLLRHRDPTSGRVLLDGVDVATLAPAELRSLVTIVPQRPDVFHGTIADNLLIARPDADRDALWGALHWAALGDWVEGLESGLDTPVGERGASISGGQMQRLALARAFLRDPRVLILDEATSELDRETERAVLEAVHAERGARTLIVVAHRMETVIAAEAIAVLDRGRLVEVGPHETLRGAGGVYAALWERHEDMLEVGA